MSSTSLAVHAFASARILPAACAPVQMIRARIDQRKCVRIEVRAIHPLVTSPGYQMPEVADHAIGKETFAVVIEIESPRIGSSVRNDFE